MRQHCCEAALGWGASLAKQLCSPALLPFTPFCSTCSALYCSYLFYSALVRQDVFDVSAPSREMQSSVEKESMLPVPEESWLIYTQKSPPLIPDWSILMKMRNPNSHSLIGPKGIGQNGATLVSEDADGDRAAWLWLDRESLCPTGWNTIPGTPL